MKLTMNQYANRIPMEAPAPVPAPLPPHLRSGMLQLVFEEEDMVRMTKIFGDIDTACAAMAVLQKAPPEKKILAKQLFQLIQTMETE